MSQAPAMPQAAHALRPMRFDGDVPVHFHAVTFPRDPRAGCELFVRRMAAFGYVSAEESGGLRGDRYVDVLDESGDILATLPVTRDGFEYMRRKLNVRREPRTPAASDGAASAAASRSDGDTRAET